MKFYFGLSTHVLSFRQITFLNAQIDRHCLKMSKVAERYASSNVITMCVVYKGEMLRGPS